MATATAAVSTATAAATATTPAATFRLGPRFVDDQVSSAKILPVQRVNGALCVFIVGNFDESETARLTRKTIADQIDRRGRHSNLREPFV
jgi:hypothetical protein